jgi:SAM-dependent methyltransferase|tara:strand:- start:3628 stop:4494 length:867 start_codon:yes stop_codon:yes gene_type:complete
MSLYTSHQNKIIGSIDQAVTNLTQILPLNNSYYAQCLEIFEANSDQRLGLLGWLEANIVAKMSQGANAILSVGCGTGAFDECILRYARQRMKQVTYLGIEPNEISAAEFSQTMGKQASNQVGVSVLLQKFEEQVFENKFDLILFVHSIYYLENRNDAIDAALKALKPGGELVIVIAPDEELNKIANLMWQRQMEQKSWFSDDVRAHFDARGLDYSEARVSANLNAKGCFGESTEVGRNIVDFIVQTQTDQLPTGLRNDIFDFLISITEGQGTTTCLPHPVDIFRCKKP